MPPAEAAIAANMRPEAAFLVFYILRILFCISAISSLPAGISHI